MCLQKQFIFLDNKNVILHLLFRLSSLYKRAFNIYTYISIRCRYILLYRVSTQILLKNSLKIL